MRLALAAVVVVVALAGTLTATAAQTTTPTHGSAITAPPSVCDLHPHPADEQRALAADVFALRRWRHPAVGGRGLALMRLLRGCVDKHAREAMAHSWRRAKHNLAIEHDYRIVSPYRGFSGEGRFLRWLPIPAYIVECESRGYHGEARWPLTNAQTGDAQGPAQLLAEHGAPRPAMTPAERLAYWQITAALWASSGAGAWACA